MTRKIGTALYIEKEPQSVCEECGTVAETRPYGEGGKRICFRCGRKDVEGTERRMGEAFLRRGSGHDA